LNVSAVRLALFFGTIPSQRHFLVINMNPWDRIGLRTRIDSYGRKMMLRKALITSMTMLTIGAGATAATVAPADAYVHFGFYFGAPYYGYGYYPYYYHHYYYRPYYYHPYHYYRPYYYHRYYYPYYRHYRYY
jgi:hypothetical protein